MKKTKKRLFAPAEQETQTLQCRKCKHISTDKTTSCVASPCMKRLSPCTNDDCEYCYKHSLAYFFDTQAFEDCFYSDSNPKSARHVWLSTRKMCLFMCTTCGHTYSQRTSNKTIRGRGCPFCKKQCPPCDNEECDFCYENTLVSYLDDATDCMDSGLNEVSSRNVWRGSSTSYNIRCMTCNHTYGQRTNVITSTKRQGCPFCTKQCLPCDDMSCEFCTNHTLSDIFEDCIYSDDNILPARKIWLGSTKLCIFQCTASGHTYFQQAYHKSAGTGCPKCKHKTQDKVHSFISTVLSEHKVEHEWSPPWLGRKRFDIAVPSLKTVWEVDGAQHYKQVSNWTAPEVVQASDRWKQARATENGFMVHRIRVCDIRPKGSKWEETITQTIELALMGAHDIYVEEK